MKIDYTSIDAWKKDIALFMERGYDIATGNIENPFIIVYSTPEDSTT